MENVKVVVTDKNTGESFELKDFNSDAVFNVPNTKESVQEELSNIFKRINSESNVLEVMKKECLRLQNTLNLLNERKLFLINTYLTNKYGCDCSGIYKLSLLHKKGNNYFEPVVIRNVLLNREPIHSYHNEKVQLLLESGVLYETKSWIDEDGEFHSLSKEDLDELLEHKNYNPVTGEDYDKDEEVWSDSECKFITRGQWIVESIVPILHLNADVVEDIKDLLETI